MLIPLRKAEAAVPAELANAALDKSVLMPAIRSCLKESNLNPGFATTTVSYISIARSVNRTASQVLLDDAQA
jgi:hypothetical protein